MTRWQRWATIFASPFLAVFFLRALAFVAGLGWGTAGGVISISVGGFLLIALATVWGEGGKL